MFRCLILLAFLFALGCGDEDDTLGRWFELEEQRSTLYEKRRAEQKILSEWQAAWPQPTEEQSRLMMEKRQYIVDLGRRIDGVMSQIPP